MFSNVSAGSVPTGDVVLNEETCGLTCLIQSLPGRQTGLHSLLGSLQQSLKDKNGQITLPPVYLTAAGPVVWVGLGINWPVTEPMGRQPGNQPGQGLQCINTYVKKYTEQGRTKRRLLLSGRHVGNFFWHYHEQH